MCEAGRNAPIDPNRELPWSEPGVATEPGRTPGSVGWLEGKDAGNDQ